jgi:hypothetical protein
MTYPGARKPPSAESGKRRANRTWLDINAEQRQNSLQDSRDADQDHQQLEQLRQPTINGKLVYRPKTDGADDNNNQNTNQSRKHLDPPIAVIAHSTTTKAQPGPACTRKVPRRGMPPALGPFLLTLAIVKFNTEPESRFRPYLYG